jgi:hypothetical protein
MIVYLALPDRGTAKQLLSAYNIEIDLPREGGGTDERKVAQRNGIVALVHGPLRGHPVDTGNTDADGLPIYELGPVLASAKNHGFHVDVYPTDELVQVTGTQEVDGELQPVYGGDFLDDVADYIVTPESPVGAVLAGRG